MVLDLLAEAMIKAIDDGAKGYLLDAFPLNLEQAKEFEEFIGTPSKIIYLSISQVTNKQLHLLIIWPFTYNYVLCDHISNQ